MTIWVYLLQNRVTESIPLDPLVNKTGGVWHVFLKGDFSDMLYGYKFDGKFSPLEGHYYDSSRILLDPYAKVSTCAVCLFLFLIILYKLKSGATKLHLLMIFCVFFSYWSGP